MIQTVNFVVLKQVYASFAVKDIITKMVFALYNPHNLDVCKKKFNKLVGIQLVRLHLYWQLLLTVNSMLL